MWTVPSRAGTATRPERRTGAAVPSIPSSPTATSTWCSPGTSAPSATRPAESQPVEHEPQPLLGFRARQLDEPVPVPGIALHGGFVRAPRLVQRLAPLGVGAV